MNVAVQMADQLPPTVSSVYTKNIFIQLSAVTEIGIVRYWGEVKNCWQFSCLKEKEKTVEYAVN